MLMLAKNLYISLNIFYNFRLDHFWFFCNFFGPWVGVVHYCKKKTQLSKPIPIKSIYVNQGLIWMLDTQHLLVTTLLVMGLSMAYLLMTCSSEANEDKHIILFLTKAQPL